MSLTSVHAPVQMFCSIGHVNFVLSSPFTIAWKMSVTAKWLCTEQFLIYRSFALQPLLLSILKHFLNSAICTSCKGEIWQTPLQDKLLSSIISHPQKTQTCTLFASSPKQMECKDLLTPGILQIHNMHLFSRLWITTCHLRENKCKILTCSTNWCQNDHIWCPFLSSL